MKYNNKNIGRFFYFIFLPLITVMVLVAIAFLGHLGERSLREQTVLQMEKTLDFQVEILGSVMDKYAVMTALIARRQDIINALVGYDQRDPLHRSADLGVGYLTNIISGISRASDIWLVAPDGKILVANDPENQDDYVTDQAYFTAAMEGRLGRDSQYDELGRRFYVFAAPVFVPGKVVGTVVVRVNLEFVEQFWALVEEPILVTDRQQKVFLANRPRWRLQPLFKDKDKASAQPSYVIEEPASQGRYRVSLAPSLSEKHNRNFLLASRYLPLLDWQLSVMSSYVPVKTQRNFIQLTSLLALSFLILGLCFWFERWQQLNKDRRLQQAFSLRLERQVKQRTHALSQTNSQLQNEIAERKLIEQDLREAQEELIQAAKLAAIGQMSTALAHEYNQPLAAIHSYAENAAAFLKKNNLDATEGNLQRIKLLVAKMAELTKTLRNFAYKSSDHTQVVNINEVMDELIILLSPQAKEKNIELVIQRCQEPCYIQGDKGHLSQLMVNLISNGMDAVAAVSAQKKVEVFWWQQGERCLLTVIDNGPGIPEDIQDKIFTPFFTTKASGSGLGLGLYIVMSIVKACKGRIELSSSASGTSFKINLPCLDKSDA